MNRSFIGPALEFPLVWFFDLAFPLISKLALNIESIEISDSDKEMLRSLQKERLLYMSNHPSTIEPPVAYYVANTMGSRFHFMASRNVFEWGMGLVGELIKRVGAFSVLAGGLDRDAVKMARSVLASPKGKLVIYPEGMNSNENDNLLPFQPGSAQIAMWALEDARKKEPDADVLILPAFVKYLLLGDYKSLTKEIEQSIGKIEKNLQIDPGDRNLLRRFLYVGRVLLENAEIEYKLDSSADTSMDYRIGRVRHAALNRAADGLGIQFAEDADAISKMRELFTTLESFELGFPDPKHPNLKPRNIPLIKKDMERAYTFIVIRPEYLLTRPTAERFMEWLSRFETLVFGQTHFRPRKAVLSFAPPIRLGNHYENYKKDKKGTIEEINKKFRMIIEDLMVKSIPLSDPIVKPMDAGPDLQLFK